MVSSFVFSAASLAIAAAPDPWQVQLHASFAGTSSFLSLVCGSSPYIRDVGVSFIAAISSATWDCVNSGCQGCWGGIGTCWQSAYGACVCWGRGTHVAGDDIQTTQTTAEAIRPVDSISDTHHKPVLVIHALASYSETSKGYVAV